MGVGVSSRPLSLTHHCWEKNKKTDTAVFHEKRLINTTLPFLCDDTVYWTLILQIIKKIQNEKCSSTLKIIQAEMRKY